MNLPRRTILALPAAAALAAVPAKTEDSFPWPPATEEFVSPNGLYRFTCKVDALSPPDPARGPIGILSRESSNPDKPESRRGLLARAFKPKPAQEIWNHELPNRYRFKFACVSNNGFVATFDDWEHLKTPNAIRIYDSSGQLTRSYSTDEVARALGVTVKDLNGYAKHGLGHWLGGRPKSMPQGDGVSIQVGGKTAILSFTDGSLKFEAPAPSLERMI